MLDLADEIKAAQEGKELVKEEGAVAVLSEAEQKARQKLELRKRVADELLSTEINYIRTLRTYLKEFGEPLKPPVS